MKHKTLEAKAVRTDRGEFSAIAAAYTTDRMNERIIPGAFAKTIQAWKASGKMIPLHYDHKGDPEYIIGAVDPGTMEELKEGLYVEGKIDLDVSDIGREAWRSMKNNAMSLSFGYLAKTRKAKDGVKELTEIDLFEITVTPAPVQPDARFLSLKSHTTSPRVEITWPDEEAAVEDETTKSPPAKSASQDPLVIEAWRAIFGRKPAA